MVAVEQATFTAPDISCGHCVSRVQTAVAAVPGVETVSANADSKRVDVTYDAALTSPLVISAALAEAGYPATH